MQGTSLNTTPSIQKYNSRISLIIIYYYTLCKGSRWAFGRCSRYFYHNKYWHKHTCGVVVATSTFAWGVTGSNPIRAIFVFFNLILARCGMHVGMRMGFAGRGNEKDSAGRGEWEWQNTEWQPVMGMGFAGRGEWERQCGEGGMGMAEHEMAAYPLPS
jgi:hypothetical protein